MNVCECIRGVIPPRVRRSSIASRLGLLKGGTSGHDGGKKVNGRKRHILVDTQGLLMKVVVHEAGLHDRAGAKLMLGEER